MSSEVIEENSLNNGHIIEVNPDMFERAANDFSEGNEYLKKLLTFCFENGIKTTGCCSGHNGEKRPYIQFEFSDKNMQAILKMLKYLSLGEIIDNFSFIKQPDITSNFIISMQNDKANEGFDQILNALQYEKEVDISEIDSTRKSIVNSLQNHNIENSYMEIQEDKDDVAIAVDINDYIIFDYGNEDPMFWTENTDLMTYPKNSKELKSTLERLENETKNKMLQSNEENNKDEYEDPMIVMEDTHELSQEELENEIKHKKEILESNEKNRRYVSEHPRNQEKINEFISESDNMRGIWHNAAATMERQHEYKEMNVAVFEVSPGTSLEDVANKLMKLSQYGQPCITEFNSIKIDTRDYNSPEELIQAYEQESEKEREKQNLNKNITIEDIEKATNEVKISDINNETEEIKQEVKKQTVELDSKNVEPEL